MTIVNTKSMTAAIALASVIGFSSFSAFAESKPVAAPATKAAAPAAAPAAAAPAEAVAEPAAAPEAAVETAPEAAAAAAPAEEAPAPAAEAQPEADPAAPAPAKAAEAPAKAPPAKAADAASGSAAHQVSLGSVVVGADGKEVGTVNRVRTEASGNVTEIHVQGKAGVVSVPGNKIASGGQNVKLSLTSDEVSKLPAVGGGRS